MVFLANYFEKEKKKENMTLSNIHLLESKKRHISQTIFSTCR